MNFADRVAQSPLSFVTGCLIWIPIAIWTFALISWMVQGDLDFGFGTMGVLVGITIGVLAVLSPNRAIVPYVFVASMSVLVLFPVVKRLVHRHNLAQLDVEQVDRAHEALRQKPDNPSALLRLARVLYDRGLQGNAIGLAERALQSVPQGYFRDETRMLQQWKAYAQDPNALSPVACLACGTTNPADAYLCSHCQSQFLLEHARGQWVVQKTAVRFIAVWTGSIGLLVGIPLTTSYAPLNWAIPLVLLEISIAIVLVAFAFVQTQGAPNA